MTKTRRQLRSLAGWGLSLSLMLLALGAFIAADVLRAEPAGKDASRGKLTLHLRTRVETKPGSGRYHALTTPVEWEAAKTAIVVCDMWDKHWCEKSTERVAQMAPRMNEVIRAARKQGVLIIHCPSDTMDFYRDTPQRRLAQQAPPAETKVPLQRWCRLDPEREGPLPIDDSNGGCDECEGDACRSYKAWTRQIATIEIADGDAITDSAEAYNLMQQRGIENVIVMGVHTNMCVLGRPFSIRQMVYQGKNVVLMRDMTDTMYDPRRAPYVSHFTGTDLVVEHIEKHWCPTITSVDFLGGEEYRFPADKRPHLVFIIAEDEYKTEETLPEFAKPLGKHFRVSFVFGNENERNDLPGLDVLKDADVAFISVRRRMLPERQLRLIREFVRAGKPVIGIRTASHAFAGRGNEQPPAGHAVWNEFDPEVLGGNYTGHHGRGPNVEIKVAENAAAHPILKGLDIGQLKGFGSHYKVSPLTKSTTALLIGTIPDHPSEPVAWANTHSGGGRAFYTSLGHLEDFKQPEFCRLLRNAVYWAAGLPVPEEASPQTVNQ